jgi:peptidoglycan hydrolase CwlO-like protein
MSIYATLKVSLEKRNMKKQNQKQSVIKRLKTAPALIAVAILVLTGTTAGIVRAATLQEQINELSAQNATKEDHVNDLQLRANNYQDAISKLQAEINSIQGAINASKAKQAELQAAIDADQKKLDQQKEYLSEDLKVMYVNGEMSTVEMLATSKNLSDFVDAETYRGAVQTKIQNTLKEIAALQNKLKEQKVQVEQLLATQQQQRDRLASDQAEQDKLLAMNKNQQASYNHQIASNKKKINALQAQQAAINAASTTAVNVSASGGSGGACDVGYGNGGYPMVWCNATQDTIATIPYSSDPINRECTSFAYWYFTNMEGKSLHVTGNAKDWAYTSNRPVTRTPHKGDIFVKTEGPYGHVGIVLALGGQNYNGYQVPVGQVLTMSMNYDYAGHFHTSLYSTGSLYYIH